MTEHETQVLAAESMAVMLEMSTGSIKVCNNIRNIPFEKLTQEDWEDIQGVSHGFEALAEFTIEAIKAGALLMTEPELMKEVLAKLEIEE